MMDKLRIKTKSMQLRDFGKNPEFDEFINDANQRIIKSIDKVI